MNNPTTCLEEEKNWNVVKSEKQGMYVESRKNGPVRLISRAGTDTDIGNRPVDVEGVESELNWESSIDINTRPSVKQKARGKLLPSTGSSAQRSVVTQAWDGGGREVQERWDIQLIHFVMSRN